MVTSRLLPELRRERVVQRPLADLEAILETAEVVLEHDTKIAGHLRILRISGEIVFQEQHPEQRQLLLRRMKSLASAEEFVRDRLETYERMWDGCGCKVDYFG